MRVCIASCGLACLLAVSGCDSATRRVVVYASQDQVYSQPILQQFERETGIAVDALYDSELVKTVGLFQRLLSERNHPRCDVLWNNEELRTRQLAAAELLPEDGWASFGYRSRRLVINTNFLSQDKAPTALHQLTNTFWRGKVAMAYPLFGSTATHFLALRQHWGEAKWRAWCRALQANDPFIVDGNSVVVQFVGRGDAWIGLTDSDDIAAGQRAGWPLVGLPLSEEMLLIPNTVALIRDGPNPAAAGALYEYLRRPEIVRELVSQGALEGERLENGVTFRPDWEAVLATIETATEELRQIFLREG